MKHPERSSAALTIALNSISSIFAPAIASSGCGKPLPATITAGGPPVNFTLQSPSGGGERKYLLSLPPSFSNRKPSPMILVFHAFTQTTTSMEETTRYSDPEINPSHVAVYPEGINNVWLGDPGAPNSSVVDDRPFINDLLDKLEDTLCVDTSRIYTTGFSNGGGLSGLLACYPPTSERIAAFSGVSAAYYTKGSLGYSLFEPEGCKPPTGRKPFLDIHGDSDMVIAYNGDNSGFDIDGNGIPDPDTLPIQTWLGDWATRNGCADPSGVYISDLLETGDVANATSMLENGNITKSTWTCGGWSDVVEGYEVKGLGHGWPSTWPLAAELEAIRLGPTSWNASTVLLDWFSRWSLPHGREDHSLIPPSMEI